MRLGLIALLCLLLSGCGFHLRGYSHQGLEYPAVSLQYTGADGILHRRLKEQLDFAGIEVRDQAQHQVVVSDTRATETTLSLSSEALTAERLVRLEAQLTLNSRDEEPRSIRLQSQQIVLENPDNPVGNASERELVNQELRTDLARNIAEQLQRWLD